MFARPPSVSGQVGSEVDVVEGSAEPLFPQPGKGERAREEGRKRTEIPPRRSNNSVERGRKGGRNGEEEEQGTPKRDRETEEARQAYIQVHSGRTTREGGRCTHRKSSFPKLSNSSRWALGRRRKRELTTHLWLTASPFLLEAIRITTVADQKGGHLSK